MDLIVLLRFMSGSRSDEARFSFQSDFTRGTDDSNLDLSQTTTTRQWKGTAISTCAEEKNSDLCGYTWSGSTPNSRNFAANCSAFRKATSARRRSCSAGVGIQLPARSYHRSHS